MRRPPNCHRTALLSSAPPELSAQRRPPRSKIFFEKLSKYIGRGIKTLLDPPNGPHCFRLHRDRVFYVSDLQVRPRHCRC